MTGYGKAESADNKRKLLVEIKTLNSKGVDLSLKLPNMFRDKELDLRNELTSSLQRGKIELSVTVEEKIESNSSLFDETVMMSYYSQIIDIASRNKLPVSENIMDTILRLPDVLKISQDVPDENAWLLLSRCLREALSHVNQFRTQEGNALAKDVSNRIQLIESYIVDLEKFESQRLEIIKTRLLQNLAEYVGENTIDRNRFEQELIYYLEKFDINEEKVRLRNHCKYFLATMNEEDGVGKKLGFVAQEIGREINTLGSKANNAEMQQIVIRMKDELEKVKEQVLNIL